MDDRRVRRSREALYSAFVALVVTKGYGRVSVKEILEEADIGRSTFYEHFASKAALLEYGFERLRGDLAGCQQDVAFGFVVDLVEHARRHLGLYRALLADDSAKLADRQMYLTVEPLVRRDLSAFWPSANVSMIAPFLTGGLLKSLEAALDDSRIGANEIRRTLEVAAGSLDWEENGRATGCDPPD